ncbi:MAG: type II toxin-antitoxin system RelE/ParE family toxin [Rhodoferax sp.]|nr:type II toxin-antitoxin system RelE/ParE family toxin [Rhodoferax sp.]
MTAPFQVRYTPATRDDLLRLFEFLLDRAQCLEDFDAAQRAIDAVRNAIEQQLSHSPFVYRKAGSSPFLRELVIPFGSAGYVALYEIEGDAHVNILALRHQREDDYH